MKTHKFKLGSYVKHKQGHGFCNPIKGKDFIVIGYDKDDWVLIGNVKDGHDGGRNIYDQSGNKIDVKLHGDQYYFVEQSWIEDITVHDVLEPTPEQKKETLKEMTKTNVILLTNSNTIMVDQNF